MNFDNIMGWRDDSEHEEPSPKLAVAERYSWYIRNALMCKCDVLAKTIKECKTTLALPENDGSALYRSLECAMDFAEQSYREHKEAQDELEKAGFK